MPNNPIKGKRADPYYQAQDILSRRDHSVGELRQKLQRKRFSQEQIDLVLQRLQAEGLVDDQRFAALYVENTLRFRAVGPRWLQAKLQQKRVAAAIIAQALAEFLPLEQEVVTAREAVARWERNHPATDRQKLFRFLASRGFSSSAISRALADSTDFS